MGAELTWDGDAIIASRIETGGIAEIAGLQPGDAVSLSGYRGAPNGGRLDLVRRTSDQKIVLEWERKPPTLARRYRPFADRSAYVRFDAFDQLSVDWLLDRLQTPHERIILDLRSNRGGQLIQCHRVLSAFLPVTTDLGAFRTRKGDRPMRASPAPPIMASTVIVLTSARTMSSAEILCENLKTLRRAVLIGDRTAGAVLAAQTYRLPDESELMLPYGDYLAPSGQSLEGLGVAPTIEAARLDEASLMRRAEGLASSI